MTSKWIRYALQLSLAGCLSVPGASAAPAQAPQEFEPEVGQEGKDVVWVPTPDELVEKMLDMAEVTPRDFVVDLGSGDGRTVIAAARRGARSLGVEFNPDMVGLSRQRAASAGVGGRAVFVEGDMFEADFGQATVLALFLLPGNLERLRPKFLDLQPGTRIVMNTFGIPDWEADVSEQIGGDCVSWCTSLLYFVPARVAGRWRVPGGELTLTQQYQVVSGSFSPTTATAAAVPITNGRLRGTEIRFASGESEYSGLVQGDTIEGAVTSNGRKSPWTATRAR